MLQEFTKFIGSPHTSTEIHVAHGTPIPEIEAVMRATRRLAELNVLKFAFGEGKNSLLLEKTGEDTLTRRGWYAIITSDLLVNHDKIMRQ